MNVGGVFGCFQCLLNKPSMYLFVYCKAHDRRQSKRPDDGSEMSVDWSETPVDCLLTDFVRRD